METRQSVVTLSHLESCGIGKQYCGATLKEVPEVAAYRLKKVLKSEPPWFIYFQSFDFDLRYQVASILIKYAIRVGQRPFLLDREDTTKLFLSKDKDPILSNRELVCLELSNDSQPNQLEARAVSRLISVRFRKGLSVVVLTPLQIFESSCSLDSYFGSQVAEIVEGKFYPIEE